MSESNVELVRRLNALFNARDPRWFDLYADDVVFAMPPEWPEEPVYRGHEELARLEALWRENFDDYRWDAVELIEAGEATVVGLFHHRGRIPNQGTWIEQAVGTLFTFRDGKVAEVRNWFSWDDALAAGGVERRPTG